MADTYLKLLENLPHKVAQEVYWHIGKTVKLVLPAEHVDNQTEPIH